jgi:hypothetical protein
MKRFLLAGVLALALLGLTQQSAKAEGWGISPGSFSINLGLNVAWSGCSFGSGCCGGGYGPCYGPGGYAPPAMYQAWGGYPFDAQGFGPGYNGHNGAQPYPTQVPVYGY